MSSDLPTKPTSPHAGDLMEVHEILRTGSSSRGIPLDTNWKRAFLVLALVVAGEWTTSAQLSRYVNVVRLAAGDEPADFLVRLFNTTRSTFMQEMMG